MPDQNRDALVNLARQRQSLGEQSEVKRVIVPRPGGLRSRQTLVNPRDPGRCVTVVGGDPALNNPAVSCPKWKPMLIRERNAFVGAALSPINVTGEYRLHPDVPKRIGERVGMFELPTIFECATGSSRGLLRVAMMPKCP
jgi:hypothetical protein